MENKHGFLSKRIRLKGWQKLLIIAACTVIAGLGAYVYCEHIATPVYMSAVKTQLHILDADTLMASADSSLTTVTLDIPGGIRDELGSVGSKGSKGLYYRNISDEVNEAAGVRLKPRDLKNMITVETDPGDPSSRTVRITVRNDDPETLRLIGDAAVSQLGVLVFGAPAGPEQATVTETAEDGALIISYTITESAQGTLPEKFLGKALDLISPLEACLADDAFCSRVAEAAGLQAKPAEIRKRIRYATTADPTALTLNVSWTDTEGAKRLAEAAGKVTADTYFGGEAQMWQYAVDEPAVVTENVKEWPMTPVIAAIAALIALLISYALFSQQPLFDTVVIIFFIVFTFICVFPFYYLFINTISDNSLVAGGQINFLPQGLHLKNYDRILGITERTDTSVDVLNSMWVTVARTVLGTALMVLTSAWAGYLVTKRKMWKRSLWYRALVVTMYFNAGLIPWYTNMLMLGLTGNFLAYIIPGMVAPYNIILVKTYIESIPGSLEESAIIDGASTFKVFMRIILPLSIPILATISIFGAVGNWNSFQDSLLLMSSTPSLHTLQHRLYVYLTQTTSINTEQISEHMAQNLLNTGVTTKYTIAMITIIPILLVYPFMQRYFVKGIMLGAVKG